MDTREEFSLACPIPLNNYPNVLLAHGGGGSLMNQLIEKMFLSTFGDPSLNKRHDAALLEQPSGRIAYTTDSYVVKPLFFPGGDIGTLAVHGTVNDLAMAGARPLYLSAGFILEEGLPMETLWKIIRSMHKAALESNVKIVTGDTKVVDKGKGDGIFINTSGIGVVEHDLVIAPASVREGDCVIVSGDLGRHGMAIMAVRDGLEFESTIKSDTAPLAEMVMTLIREKLEVHCLRDLTRGGLASALNEIAQGCAMNIEIDEKSIPVREDVRGACEILGLDPIYVANEGRCVVFVPEEQTQRTLKLLRQTSCGAGATLIGKVKRASPSTKPLVLMNSLIGAQRIVDMLSGEQLPRIC